jgi:hypothetical protein
LPVAPGDAYHTKIRHSLRGYLSRLNTVNCRLEQHHAGIYTVEARNEAGEARSGATVNVISIGGPSYTRIEESTTQEYVGSRLVRVGT